MAQLFRDGLNKYFENNIKASLVTNNNVVIQTTDGYYYDLDRKGFRSYKNLAFTMDCDQDKINKIVHYSKLNELTSKDLTIIRRSKRFALGLNSNGNAYIWGHLKVDANEKSLTKPRILSIENVIDIRCGSSHSLLLTQNGKVYSIGYNSLYQCGFDDCDYIETPKEIDKLEGERMSQIRCGPYNSIALTEKNNIYVWGDIGSKLSVPNSTFLPHLIKFEGLDGKFFINCNSLYSDIVISANDSHIKTFGKDRKINNPLLNNINAEVTEIASHLEFPISVARTLDNKIYVWGENDQGNFSKPEIYFEMGEIKLVFERQYKINIDLIYGRLTSFDDIFYINDKYKNHFKENYLIKEGGYGKVYNVTDRRCNQGFNQEFALKRVVLSQDEKVNNQKAFINDLISCELINKIESDFILKYKEFWLEKDEKLNITEFYILSEILDYNLEDVLNKIKNDYEFSSKFKMLVTFLKLKIFIQILEGVSVLHKNDLLHRDLYANNIMFKIDDNISNFVKIIDFELTTRHSDIFDDIDNLHSPNVHSQQYRYVAPEVRNHGQIIYSKKADIFSLGDILMFMFSDIDNDELVDIPLEIEIRMNQMLSFDPNDRPVCQYLIRWFKEFFEKFINENDPKELYDDLLKLEQMDSYPRRLLTKIFY